MIYKAYITSDYYMPDPNEKGLLNWASDVLKETHDSKLIAEDDTLEGCKTKLFKECEGSRWYFYPSAYIENDIDGWVWDAICIVNKCRHCKHVRYSLT